MAKLPRKVASLAASATRTLFFWLEERPRLFARAAVHTTNKFHLFLPPLPPSHACASAPPNLLYHSSCKDVADESEVAVKKIPRAFDDLVDAKRILREIMVR